MGPEATLQSAESERSHRCPDCGVPYTTQEDEEGCPVCLLRRAMQPEATVQDLPDEDRFDHYEIVRRDGGCFDELGRGAMGVTYRALDTVLGHAVALKVIDARIAGSADARERFLREARAAARLRHPNIASVFYYGVRRSDGQCFYAMELVEGETLEARMRRDRSLSASFALDVVAQVARAMVARREPRVGAPGLEASQPDAGERSGPHGQDHRFRPGQSGGCQRIGHHSRRVCRDTRFCQPRAILGEPMWTFARIFTRWA